MYIRTPTGNQVPDFYNILRLYVPGPDVEATIEIAWKYPVQQIMFTYEKVKVIKENSFWNMAHQCRHYSRFIL